jgi:hypothetical protein
MHIYKYQKPVVVKRARDLLHYATYKHIFLPHVIPSGRDASMVIGKTE